MSDVGIVIERDEAYSVAVRQGEGVTNINASEIVGANIADLRKARGINGDEMLRLMRDKGIVWSRPRLTNVEAGKHAVDVEELMQLAEILDASFWRFFVPPPEYLDSPMRRMRAWEWLKELFDPESDDSAHNIFVRLLEVASDVSLKQGITEGTRYVTRLASNHMQQ